MTMSLRERILSVYDGKTPDVVPFMLDLSHYFYHKHRLPWDISRAYEKPERELIDYHRRMNVGFYIPNLGTFLETVYPEDVTLSVQKNADGRTITWAFGTPLGNIERTRIWKKDTYSWGMASWGIQTEQQLKILAYALGNRKYRFLSEKYQAWSDYIGDIGVCYLPFGYSAMGQLLNYWMGIEGTIYATVDYPDTVRMVVDQINENNLLLIDMLADSNLEFICLGDNFSSDIQPPHFFNRWSRDFYTQAIRRLHAAGKFVAVHIDGRLRGALRIFAEIGADCADAVTPAPMGDLTPQQCRDEAGPGLILSGGVPPNLWLSETKTEVFKKAVLDWLELRKQSPRLIANAGDQVPPCAAEERIEIMRDLVEKYGRI